MLIAETKYYSPQTSIAKICYFVMIQYLLIIKRFFYLARVLTLIFFFYSQSDIAFILLLNFE